MWMEGYFKALVPNSFLLLVVRHLLLLAMHLLLLAKGFVAQALCLEGCHLACSERTTGAPRLVRLQQNSPPQPCRHSRLVPAAAPSSMSTQAQRVDPDAKAAPKPADVKDVKPVKASKPRIDCSWSELRV